MVTSEMFKYIGNEYWMAPMGVKGFMKRYTLFGFNPTKGNVILDGGDGEDMFEFPIDKFPFEDYIREEN